MHLLAMRTVQPTVDLGTVCLDPALNGSTVDGQAALCWITAAKGFFYVANAGSSSISGYRIAPDGRRR